MAILMPGTDQVAAGPARDLLVALHRLYRGAGTPSVRSIAKAVFDGDFRDTVSHETVAAILRGTVVPRWIKLEPVVRVLAGWHVPSVAIEPEVAAILQLWHHTQNIAVAVSVPSTSASNDDTASSTRPGEGEPKPRRWSVDELAAMHPDRASAHVADMNEEAIAELLTNTGYSEDGSYKELANVRLAADLVQRMAPKRAWLVLNSLHYSLKSELIAAIPVDHAVAVLRSAPVDDLDVFRHLSSEKCAELLSKIETERAAAIMARFGQKTLTATLERMAPEVVETIVEGFDADRAAAMLAAMKPQRLALVIGVMDAERASEVLPAMSPSAAGAVVREGNPRSVGAVLAGMEPDVVAGLVVAMKPRRIAALLDDAPAALTAVVLSRMPVDQAATMLAALRPERCGAVLSVLDRDHAKAVLARTRLSQVATVRAAMDPDAVVELGAHVRRRFWRRG